MVKMKLAPLENEAVYKGGRYRGQLRGEEGRKKLWLREVPSKCCSIFKLRAVWRWKERSLERWKLVGGSKVAIDGGYGR